MKALHIMSLGELALLDVPEPRIEKDDNVLVRVKVVGVCGSDVHYYETGRIGTQVVTFPYRVGHECAGEVVKTGPGAKTLKPGDRVSVDPAMPCHTCDQCRKDRENTCRNLKFLGVPGEGLGCMAEYMVMPEKSLFAIPDSMTMEQAALCEPLSIGLYAVKRANLPPRAHVLIQGAGPIGLSVMLAARAAGAEKVYMTDKIAPRRAAALRNGADWVADASEKHLAQQVLKMEPLGLDCVFECAGQQETVGQAAAMVGPGGRFTYVGIPRVDSISFDLHQFRRRDVDIINIRRQNQMHGKCIEMVAKGELNADFMVTHRFTLAESARAFSLLSKYEDGVIKAMVSI